MKKIFMLAVAAFLVSGVAFANGGGDKKKCAKGKECCKKDAKKAETCSKDKKEKDCCKKDAKKTEEAKKS